MNLLAHAVLSPDKGLIRVGNVVADFLHRNETDSLEPRLKVGYDLHQRIDKFTDHDATVARSHQRLIGFRRYANPLVDVFYDHFLSKHWSDSDTLADYVADLYRSIEDTASLLPEGCFAISQRMISDDWLSQYDTFEGLAVNLARMERRIQWGSGRTVDLVGSLTVLESDYAGFEADFLEFWPRLQAHLTESFPS